MTSDFGKERLIRPLGEAERFFWLFDRVNCMNFAIYAELDEALETGDVQQSLNDLVAMTPALRVRVEAEGKKLFFVEGDTPQIQVEKIQQPDDWKGRVLTEMVRPFIPCSLPMIRCLLVEGEQTASVVVVIFNHTIADGRSGIQFTKRLLRRVLGERCEVPDEDALLPAMESLFPDKYQNIGGKIRGNLFRLKERFEWKRYGKLESFPDYSSEIKQAREASSFQLTLEEALLTNLKAKARKEKTTLHGLIGAAQLLALRDEFGDDASHPMLLTSLADMRGQLTQSVPAETLALQVTFLVAAHRVEHNGSIWELARDVRQQLQEKLANGEGHHFWNSLPSSLFVPPNQKGAERLLKITKWLSPPSTLISNMGDVSDPEPTRLSQVQNLSLLICPSSVTPINNTVNSWNGRLIINLNYDALKMDSARIERIAKTMEWFIGQAEEN